MEVPTKCNEFRRPALCFVQNFVKRHCTLSCRLKTRCENATSFSKKWGGSSQNEGTFSSSLRTFQSPSPSSPSVAAAERLVPHFSPFRLALSIFTFTRRGVFISRTRPYTHVAIAFAHITEFRFSMFTLHLAHNCFVQRRLR